MTVMEKLPTRHENRGARLSDYDYALPERLIAQHPLKERTSARLLQVSRKEDALSHEVFKDIAQFFKPGDVLVLNNTKVIPARLLGRRSTGGQTEIFLLKETGSSEWEALVRPSGRISKGSVLFLGEDQDFQAEILDEPRPGSGMRKVRFLGAGVREKIWKSGHIPLPPYITREDTPEDKEYYQTVFASREGAVAAPTAGLHFDEALLGQLEAKGVQILYVTLHTGYGTFQPVNAEDLSRHEMFYEEYEVDEKTAGLINAAKKEGRRVIACGTTVVRSLESAASVPEGELKACRGTTNLFIYPPYDFKVIDGMITNFHLPKSTLLMLVSAFLGYDKLLRAYEEAVKSEYRFYSYGDAMMII